MRKLLFLVAAAAFISCGNGDPAKSTDTTTATVDTSLPGTVITDTTGSAIMKTDTTGMGTAR